MNGDMQQDKHAHTAYDETTQVLIVGGSLVGLSMSLFLSQQGIASLVVERHPGTSIHPRLSGVMPRSLELFRSVGVEQAIRQVEPPFPQEGFLPVMESLLGKELDRLMEDMSDFMTDESPSRGSIVAQDVLEPVLRARAEQMGGDLRYAHELVSFEQDEQGVTATIRERNSGATRQVRASFLVAADGGGSGVRQQLGIQRHGVGTLAQVVSIIFEADLIEQFRKRHAIMCFIKNATLPFASMVPYEGSSARPPVFRLDIPYDPGVETLEAYDEERCLSLIRAAVGAPDLSARIKTVLSWEMAARIADHFQQGRVFLVGDAARVQPPTGGLGGNTGISEAHNLAWKLAAVLRGEASQALLATYDQERRPLADLTTEQVALLSRQRQQGHEAITVNTLALSMGYRYPTGAVIAESGDDLPLLQAPQKWHGEPGTRAPHLVLTRAGQPLSTLDLFDRHFVLLVGEEGQGWLPAAHAAAAQLHISLQVYQLGTDLVDVQGKFLPAYGISATGATLVRPDGFIAWRSQVLAEEPEHLLTHTLAKLLFRVNPFFS